MAMSAEVIYQAAEKQGFTVVSIKRVGNSPYVRLMCSKGHIRGCSAYDVHKESCHICKGKRFDLDKATSLLQSEGYSFFNNPTLEEDRHGNLVLKAATRFISVCPNNHKQHMTLNEFVSGKRCTTCSGTAFSAGYSRSEEIIARVLDYIGVTYNRQTTTGEAFGNLRLDFCLPFLRTIIEYDGEHHVYGRSTTSEQQLADMKQRDSMRDEYADHIGFLMIRISHNYAGKALVYHLSEMFHNIDPKDPYYDQIVREVFNEAAERFEWLTYEQIKRNADTYLHNSLSDSASLTGVSQTVIAKHFRWVYGMNKADYVRQKNMR